MRSRLKACFQRLARNTLGNISLAMALTAVPLVGIAGGAIDYARLHTARTTVSSAIDGAVLAGTRSLMEKKNAKLAIQTADAYFAANTSSMPELVGETIAFTLNDKGTGIVASGNASIQTSFLSVLQIKTLALYSDSGASGAAEVGGSTGGDLEIALMLDVTGSMCNDGVGPCTSSTKMDALKLAANTLIDTVVWSDQSKFTSRVAIVPFSTRVRVGQDGTLGHMTKLTGLPAAWSGWYKTCTASSGSGASETSGSWTCTKYKTQKYSGWKIMPCVTDRFYNSTWTFDLTDNDPKAGAWLNAHGGDRMAEAEDSSATKAKTALGAKSSDPATHWNFDSTGTCYDVANANEVLPLSNDTANLKAKINSLEAYGATAGVLGTAFSWYMLSPNWNNIWPGPSKAGDYALLTQKNPGGALKLRKVAILMTDGVYNTMRGWKEQDTTFISDNAIAMCNAMKAKGIEIYTIGFALDSLTTSERALAEKTLLGCGTDVDHFYKSIDAGNLQATFSKIGTKVASSSLRLTD